MDSSSSMQKSKQLPYRIMHIIIILSAFNKNVAAFTSVPMSSVTWSRSQTEPQVRNWGQELSLPQDKYDGHGAMLGGLIGGGLGTTLGGMLGEDFAMVFGGFGGLMGGAVGSSLDTNTNGLSVLGSAIGGSIGAGLGIRLKGYIFSGRDGSGHKQFLPQGLLDTASSAVSKPLEGIQNATVMAKPLMDAVGKPLEGVTGVVTPPLPKVPTNFPGSLSEVSKPLTDGVGKVTTPLQNVIGRESREVRQLSPPSPVSTVTGLASAPVGIAVDTAGSVVAGSIFKALSQPMLAGAMSGIFGAIGGGVGALIGGFGLNVMQNLIM